MNRKVNLSKRVRTTAGLGSTNPFMSPPGLQSRCPSCRFAEAAGPP
jgi:hypothetical protein